MHNRTSRATLPFLAALVTGFLGVAAPAWGQPINEDLKLLADDGAAGDGFGGSIANTMTIWADWVRRRWIRATSPCPT